jgi:hypothetical protein
VAADYLRVSQRAGHGAATAALAEGSGSAYDPAIVEAATAVLTARAGTLARAR